MEISGSYEFNAPAERVWNALLDPTVLASCIPGVESFDPVGVAEYSAVVNLGVGPIRGRFNAKIFLKDQKPHESYRLVVQGSGPTGFANGESLFTLVEQDCKTVVHVKSEAQAGGTMARVGQRLMGTVAKGMLDRFFNCLQESVN